MSMTFGILFHCEEPMHGKIAYYAGPSKIRFGARLPTRCRQERAYIHVVAHNIEIAGRDAHRLEGRSILCGWLCKLDA